MDKAEFRKTITSNLIQLLKKEQPHSTYNLQSIQSHFLAKKTSEDNNPSELNQKLARKVFGINYRCIADVQQFHYSNSIKALTLAIMQIAFQDFYTASLLVNQLKNNYEQFINIKGFPLQSVCPSNQYSAIITQIFLQLCQICQQRTDLPLRDILSMSHFGLEMISLILRSILIKMHYPNAQNYMVQLSNSNIHEIFTIICQYLDINMVANISKNSQGNSGQIFLFADYNIFIASYNNLQFICGRYFQNQDELRQTQQIDQIEIEMLLRLRQIDTQQRNTSKNAQNSDKPDNISEFNLDLRVSGSEFSFPQNQETGCFVNGNAQTPEFGIVQNFKFRKSMEKDQNATDNNNRYHKYHKSIQKNQNSTKTKFQSIQQASESLQTNLKVTQFTKNKKKYQQNSQFSQQFIKAPRTSQQTNLNRPQIPPLLAGLAGIAQLKIVKNKNQQKLGKTVKQTQQQNFEGISPIIRNEKPQFTCQNNKNYIYPPSNTSAHEILTNLQNEQTQFQKISRKMYKGSFNYMKTTPLFSPISSGKKSALLNSQKQQNQHQMTPTSSSGLGNILQRIKKQNQDIKMRINKKNFKQQKAIQRSKLYDENRNKSLSQRSHANQKKDTSNLKTQTNKARNISPKNLEERFRKLSQNRIIRDIELQRKMTADDFHQRNVISSNGETQKMMKSNLANNKKISDKNNQIRQKLNGLNLDLSSNKLLKNEDKIIVTPQSPETYRSSKKADGDKNCNTIHNKKTQNVQCKFPQFLRNKKKQNNAEKGIKTLKVSHQTLHFSGSKLTNQNYKFKLSPRQKKCIDSNKVNYIPTQMDGALNKSKNTQSHPVFVPEAHHKNMNPIKNAFKNSEMYPYTSKLIEDKKQTNHLSTDNLNPSFNMYKRQKSQINNNKLNSQNSISNFNSFKETAKYTKYAHGSVYRSNGNLFPNYCPNAQQKYSKPVQQINKDKKSFIGSPKNPSEHSISINRKI